MKTLIASISRVVTNPEFDKMTKTAAFDSSQPINIGGLEIPPAVLTSALAGGGLAPLLGGLGGNLSGSQLALLAAMGLLGGAGAGYMFDQSDEPTNGGADSGDPSLSGHIAGGGAVGAGMSMAGLRPGVSPLARVMQSPEGNPVELQRQLVNEFGMDADQAKRMAPVMEAYRSGIRKKLQTSGEEFDPRRAATGFVDKYQRGNLQLDDYEFDRPTTQSIVQGRINSLKSRLKAMDDMDPDKARMQQGLANLEGLGAGAEGASIRGSYNPVTGRATGAQLHGLNSPLNLGDLDVGATSFDDIMNKIRPGTGDVFKPVHLKSPKSWLNGMRIKRPSGRGLGIGGALGALAGGIYGAS